MQRREERKKKTGDKRKNLENVSRLEPVFGITKDKKKIKREK